MFCRICGKKMANSIKFCGNCGTKTNFVEVSGQQIDFWGWSQQNSCFLGGAPPLCDNVVKPVQTIDYKHTMRLAIRRQE